MNELKVKGSKHNEQGHAELDSASPTNRESLTTKGDSKSSLE